MLDSDRKFYLTASVAHIAMADYELELEGMKMTRPDCATDEVIKHIKDGKGTRVGDFKGAGIEITGAEIKEVLRYVKSTTPIFSKGMETAAERVAMNAFFSQRDEGFKSKDMERGNIQEGEAVLALQEKLGIEFENTLDNQSFLTRDFLGVTPDAIQFGDNFNIVSCSEVKNPKDTTHMRYLARIKTQEDMLKECPDYYWQAQTGLYVTQAEVYHWASYHNGAEPKYRLVYCPIEPNEEHIKILRIRAERIAERVPEIIEDIKNRY